MMDYNPQLQFNSVPTHRPKHDGSLKTVMYSSYACAAAISCEVSHEAEARHGPLQQVSSVCRCVNDLISVGGITYLTVCYNKVLRSATVLAMSIMQRTRCTTFILHNTLFNYTGKTHVWSVLS